MHSQVSHRHTYIWLALSAAAYLALGYFTERTNFALVLSWFGLACIGYTRLVRSDLTVKQGIAAAMLLRMLFIAAVPALSDDYFRFIWDGRLLANGINPYQFLPHEFYPDQLQQYNLTAQLYAGLNSKHYFTIYPPVCQFIFWLAGLVAPHQEVLAIMVMRVFILSAEAGTMWLLVKILHKLALPEKQLFWYAFNPLVIIELSGNLHFEALMIFFILLSLYQLLLHRQVASAVTLGLGIGVKLLPIMFLPFLIRQLGWFSFIKFAAVVVVVIVLMFFPFYSQQLFHKIFSSIDLYFQKFEFNAAIYFLIREVGFWITGYNQIHKIGPALSVIAFLGIMLTVVLERHSTISSLFGSCLAALSIYLFLATTVHPWYITTLVALCACTRFRYPAIWSIVTVLSYAAYQNPDYQENLVLVSLEYTVVFIWLAVELYAFRIRKPLHNLLEKRKSRKRKNSLPASDK
ncbi:MAG: hypothetical protein LPJ89_07525 [Hymenobacteraceae bacterium]|nr:hypothetical protein [Hymenobacteraceae bacterium]MDX5397696.1 hypothetical protein [Hymenobacteraceae bacterium]MDX5443616.1 hypothetical protein [Hymenobacteraceae bacterium]MDX5513774.1 hypothetical protein [Hymenobacteraceae bacterium]